MLVIHSTKATTSQDQHGSCQVKATAALMSNVAALLQLSSNVTACNTYKKVISFAGGHLGEFLNG